MFCSWNLQGLETAMVATHNDGLVGHCIETCAVFTLNLDFTPNYPGMAPLHKRIRSFVLYMIDFWRKKIPT